jgi:pimeloyl-ACP methyl ester carboxylesterase
MSKTVLFIHDAWLASNVWECFQGRCEALGYSCLAPAWPFQDRPIMALRGAPHPDLGRLTIGEIVDHYAWIIHTLPDPPILIGHGFGGLVVQKLLDRGLGAAGIAISPVAPRGVLPTFTAFGSALPIVLAWRPWPRILGMTFRYFARHFAHLSPEAEQRAAYERYVVPAPGWIHLHALLGIGGQVGFGKLDRAPLLLIAGEDDRIAAPSTVEAIYRRYARSHAQTDYKRFAGRAHLLIVMQGWEEIADHVIEWVCDNALESPVETPMALTRRR